MRNRAKQDLDAILLKNLVCRLMKKDTFSHTATMLVDHAKNQVT